MTRRRSVRRRRFAGGAPSTGKSRTGNRDHSTEPPRTANRRGRDKKSRPSPEGLPSKKKHSVRKDPPAGESRPARKGRRPPPNPRGAPRYRMPAEFEPHVATWISWPHHAPDWPGKLATIQWVYVEIARALVRSEPVRILVRDAASRARVRKLLARAHVPQENIAFYVVPTNRSWIRDYGPIFVRRGREVVMTDWKFNGWARYANWRLDNGVNAKIAKFLGVPRITPRAGKEDVVLEGGSVDVNGQGTLLTTEACHLSKVQARNPGLARADLEKLFREWLGARQVIWLGEGIAGDDTHGHVDDIARFVDPATIVAVREGSRRDENREPLEENLRRLREARDPQGRPFRVVTLPMPEPIWYEGERLPASYANFYIGNRTVLVPTFNDPNDLLALDTLGRLFPGREVVGIHSVDLILGLGTIHCLTQQQPG